MHQSQTHNIDFEGSAAVKRRQRIHCMQHESRVGESTYNEGLGRERRGVISLEPLVRPTPILNVVHLVRLEASRTDPTEERRFEQEPKPGTARFFTPISPPASAGIVCEGFRMLPDLD